MRRKPNPYITPTIAAARKAMFAASILRSVFAITRTLSGWLPRKRGSSATRPHKLRPKASPNTMTKALALRGNLFAQPAMVLDSLAGAEVVQLEQLPDLDFAILIMRVGAALESSSSEGILPASESLVALTITMKRIVVFSSSIRFGAGLILALLCRRTKGCKIDRCVTFFFGMAILGASCT